MSTIIEAAVAELKSIAASLKSGILVVCDEIINQVEALIAKLVDKPFSFCFNIFGTHCCFSWEITTESDNAYHLILTLKDYFGSDTEMKAPFINLSTDIRLANVGFLSTFLNALIAHI